jgi:putative ABC transport system permease protein
MVTYHRLRLWVRSLRLRLRFLLRKGAVERELDEELRFHLQEAVEANLRSGMTLREARRQAFLAFGGTERYKEQVRDAHGVRIVDVFLQDLRYALRAFAHAPGFTTASVLILGVGIGATTTIFSVVDTVVLRPLPYPEEGELVFFENGSHRVPDFLEWRDHTQAFSSVGAAWERQMDLTGGGAPESLRVAEVTQEFLPMLGATPLLGRLFMRDDFRGEPTVALLSHGLWARRWGSDPEIVGRQVRLSGLSVVVAGIVAPEFRPPEAATGERVDAWVPLDVARPELQVRTLRMLSVVGRLRGGVTRATAQAEMDAMIAGLAQEFPEQYTRMDGSLQLVPLVPLREAGLADVTPVLFTLLGAVGFMLLIACANVANLFLARGTGRAREIALRKAIGAGQSRIVGQFLTESSLLAVAGGVLGVALAYLGVGVFLRYNTGAVPRLQDLGVDVRILLFAVVASVGTGVLCGILPALQAIRRDPSRSLSEGTANATTGIERRKARSALVVAEIALTLVLLTGAGLLFRSFLERVHVDPGFQTEELVTIPLTLQGEGRFYHGGRYSEDERAQFLRELTQRVQSMPGVRAVAAGWTLPFERVGSSRCCWGNDVVPAGGEVGEDAPIFWIHPVTPDYFGTLSAPLTSGREFTPADANTDPFVAILNERTALHLFGRADVVGERIRLDGEGEFEVVGVVRGVQHWGLDQDIDLAVYVPWDRFGTFMPRVHFAIRVDAATETLIPALRQAIWAIDPDLPIEEVVTMRDRVDRSLAGPRFLSMIFAFFAGVGLLLASGGVYASMLYTVGQKRREMGIRIALGAPRHRVMRWILRHGLVLTALGLGLGLAGAFGLTRFLRSIVWGVTPTDASTFSSATLLLALAALGACVVPAVKAIRTDPLETLKAE